MTILYIIFAAIALGILVFIHELGHYFAARLTGMTVEAFSIGFGRALIKWRWQGVDWQLGWLPFGGYVRIAGMDVSKKDKNAYVEPKDIPGGFFAKSPLKRIIVAIAGPLANFILALLIFCILWFMGGRQKNFSEFTHVIGWVDPQSELYMDGVRPGDILSKYNDHPFTSSKDLLYAAMLGDRKVKLDGFHVNYTTGEKTPFSYTIESYQARNAMEGIRTIGITSTARYLIYDRLSSNTPNILPAGSPMEESGIGYRDRLIWADGELLFSMDQLSHLINEKKALLTVKRGSNIFLSRQPRVKVEELLIPTLVRNELIDWQYEAGIQGRWQDLFVLPYNLTADAVVENSIGFIDADIEKQVYPRHLFSEPLERPLQVGDRIIAIDGVPITTAYQLLDLLQTHHVSMIVQKGVSAHASQSWKTADVAFERSLQWQTLQPIVNTIGIKNSVKESGSYLLLNPVEPKRIDQFNLSEESQNQMKESYSAKKQEILQMKDQEKRSRALLALEQEYNKYLLGVYLQDQTVHYNPNPFVMFGNAFTETWQTLKALVMGYLNPKWISGPVGIVQVIHHGWQVGIGEALFWIAAISLNLGFLNLLPIPVLDGGYICISLWEMITRRPLKAKTMERLIIPFVVLLIALLIFLTFQDITRLF